MAHQSEDSAVHATKCEALPSLSFTEPRRISHSAAVVVVVVVVVVVATVGIVERK